MRVIRNLSVLTLLVAIVVVGRTSPVKAWCDAGGSACLIDPVEVCGTDTDCDYICSSCDGAAYIGGGAWCDGDPFWDQGWCSNQCCQCEQPF